MGFTLSTGCRCVNGKAGSILRTMPIVNQISVFVENRPGRLGELCEVLAEEGINIQAMMLPSGTDYGIVHVVVDRHEAALQALEQRRYRSYTNRVLDLMLEDHPGALAEMADRLSEGSVDIKYAYGAVAEGRGRLILAVSDAERANEVLSS